MERGRQKVRQGDGERETEGEMEIEMGEGGEETG